MQLQLIRVSRMSKVDYRNKVLPKNKVSKKRHTTPLNKITIHQKAHPESDLGLEKAANQI